MKLKSPITLVRKAIAAKGKSRHNGRGSVRMYHDLTPAEIQQRFQRAARKFNEAGMLEHEIVESENFGYSVFMFKLGATNDDYYRAVMLDDNGDLNVRFTKPN